MNGIFITAELEGELAERIHVLQEEFDPKMARHLPPHITLTGSSGAGPLPSSTPVAELNTVPSLSKKMRSAGKGRVRSCAWGIGGRISYGGAEALK